MPCGFAASENFPGHRAIDGNQQSFVRRADGARKIESVNAKVISFRNRHGRGAAAERLSNAGRDGSQQVARLKIATIETNAAITLELHGRSIGAWVPVLATLWKSNAGGPSGRTVVVDVTGVAEIDGAACYLLRLMEAKNVTLSGGGIGIRALLGDDKGGKQNEIR